MTPLLVGSLLSRQPGALWFLVTVMTFMIAVVVLVSPGMGRSLQTGAAVEPEGTVD